MGCIRFSRTKGCCASRAGRRSRLSARSAGRPAGGGVGSRGTRRRGLIYIRALGAKFAGSTDSSGHYLWLTKQKARGLLPTPGAYSVHEARARRAHGRVGPQGSFGPSRGAGLFRRWELPAAEWALVRSGHNQARARPGCAKLREAMRLRSERAAAGVRRSGRRQRQRAAWATLGVANGS